MITVAVARARAVTAVAVAAVAVADVAKEVLSRSRARVAKDARGSSYEEISRPPSRYRKEWVRLMRSLEDSDSEEALGNDHSGDLEDGSDWLYSDDEPPSTRRITSIIKSRDPAPENKEGDEAIPRTKKSQAGEDEPPTAGGNSGRPS